MNTSANTSAVAFDNPTGFLGALRLVLGYLAIDFICTMLNRYVFKNEK